MDAQHKINYCHDKKFVVTFELSLYTIYVHEKHMYAMRQKTIKFFLKKVNI